MDIWTKKALDRFITYVKIDTQSNEESSSSPSAEKEYNLLRLLEKQLKELGIAAEIDEYGRLYAFLEGEKDYPVIGLNSHVDTASEASGANVNPQFIEGYDGKTIHLKNGAKMSPEDFPALRGHEGDTLITTDGTTLLGGDDKAGVALIMNLAEYLVTHKEIKHHPLAILFTPDEEIGRGAENFNKEKFHAEWAYTVDGDYPLSIDSENFNAASAEIQIQGIAIHPGEAKDKLVNALRLAYEIDLELPAASRPENTEGREGFFHLLEISGSSAEATVRYILREHDKDKFQNLKITLQKACEKVEKTHPGVKVSLSIHDQYRNMKEVFAKDNRAIDHAKKAFASLHLVPKENPIRGGTDGATFSFLGVPCPNLGTGTYNHHGCYEFLSVRDFDLMRQLLEEIIKI